MVLIREYSPVSRKEVVYESASESELPRALLAQLYPWYVQLFSEVEKGPTAKLKTREEFSNQLRSLSEETRNEYIALLRQRMAEGGRGVPVG
jgi:hypothetical protein